jgi:hypothetical protein
VLRARYCLVCGRPLALVREAGRTRRRCPACGWTYYVNPVPAVVAVIQRGQRLLLTRRARPPYPGTWDLPGGFLEGPRPASGAGDAFLQLVVRRLERRDEIVLPPGGEPDLAL